VSANRDSETFADGDQFDIRRPNASQHLAFGWGRHHCIGSDLARLEMRVVLEELTNRLPQLCLVENQQWEFSPNADQCRRTIAEMFPDRFVLGLGVSHGPMMAQVGIKYEKPVAHTRLRGEDEGGSIRCTQAGLGSSDHDRSLGARQSQRARAVGSPH
jgi:hypothetical protein